MAVRVIRARGAGKTDRSGSGSRAPREPGVGVTRATRRDTARGRHLCGRRPAVADEQLLDLGQRELDGLLRHREATPLDQPATRLEQRSPQQTHRPLDGHRAVVVTQVQGQASLRQRLVEGGPLRGGHPRAERCRGGIACGRRGGFVERLRCSQARWRAAPPAAPRPFARPGRTPSRCASRTPAGSRRGPTTRWGPPRAAPRGCSGAGRSLVHPASSEGEPDLAQGLHRGRGAR